MTPGTPLAPDGPAPPDGGEAPRQRTVVVRYAHEVDSLDRVASILRRQRVRVEAFTAVAAPDGATAQATIMFESSDKTAARIVALLGRQVGVIAVEEWSDDDSR